jgi:hypothetical protein
LSGKNVVRRTLEELERIVNKGNHQKMGEGNLKCGSDCKDVGSKEQTRPKEHAQVECVGESVCVDGAKQSVVDGGAREGKSVTRISNVQQGEEGLYLL